MRDIGLDFTDEVFAAIKKRLRAIRYRGLDVEVDRIKEVPDGIEQHLRRINIDVTYGSMDLRFSVWSDRWIWLYARRRKKKKPAWSTTIEGRFTGKGAAGLVQRIETTLNAVHHDDPGVTIKEIWESDLAQGPRRT